MRLLKTIHTSPVYSLNNIIMFLHMCARLPKVIKEMSAENVLMTSLHYYNDYDLPFKRSDI